MNTVLIFSSHEQIKQIKDLDFTYLPFAPLADDSEIIEAELYARKLKENELLKSGIDVEKMKEEAKDEDIRMNPILSKFYEAKKENENKVDPDKIKDSFSKYKVLIKLNIFSFIAPNEFQG